MNRIFKTLPLVLFAVIVVQSVAVVVLYRRNEQLAKSRPVAYVIAYPRFDWNLLSTQCRVELLSALIFDEVSFDNQTLSECLKQLSDKTSGILGKGFSFFIRSPGSQPLPDPRVSLKFKATTFQKILKTLGETSGSTIEVKEGGVFVNYKKPPEANP